MTYKAELRIGYSNSSDYKVEGQATANTEEKVLAQLKQQVLEVIKDRIERNDYENTLLFHRFAQLHPYRYPGTVDNKWDQIWTQILNQERPYETLCVSEDSEPLTTESSSEGMSP